LESAVSLETTEAECAAPVVIEQLMAALGGLRIAVTTIDHDERGRKIAPTKVLRVEITSQDGQTVHFDKPLFMAPGFAEAILRLYRHAHETEKPVSQELAANG
jgi:hypothetical protein